MPIVGLNVAREAMPTSAKDSEAFAQFHASNGRAKSDDGTADLRHYGSPHFTPTASSCARRTVEFSKSFRFP
jgi:hypothetical protein